MRDTAETDGSIHDDYRVDYFRRHFKEMEAAIDDGVELMGYTSWAPIDLISAGTNPCPPNNTKSNLSELLFTDVLTILCKGAYVKWKMKKNQAARLC